MRYYLSQCWFGSMPLYGVSGPQWINLRPWYSFSGSYSLAINEVLYHVDEFVLKNGNPSEWAINSGFLLLTNRYYLYIQWSFLKKSKSNSNCVKFKILWSLPSFLYKNMEYMKIIKWGVSNYRGIWKDGIWTIFLGINCNNFVDLYTAVLSFMLRV